MDIQHVNQYRHCLGQTPPNEMINMLEFHMIHGGTCMIIYWISKILTFKKKIQYSYELQQLWKEQLRARFGFANHLPLAELHVSHPTRSGCRAKSVHLRPTYPVQCCLGSHHERQKWAPKTNLTIAMNFQLPKSTCKLWTYWL